MNTRLHPSKRLTHCSASLCVSPLLHCLVQLQLQLQHCRPHQSGSHHAFERVFAYDIQHCYVLVAADGKLTLPAGKGATCGTCGVQAGRGPSSSVDLATTQIMVKRGTVSDPASQYALLGAAEALNLRVSRCLDSGSNGFHHARLVHEVHTKLCFAATRNIRKAIQPKPLHLTFRNGCSSRPIQEE